jgi:sugar/nucleoside kinase (ribokinase family)
MSYRVFISYSHGDIETVQRVVEVLKANGLTILWDQDFAFGRGFHEQIKTFISYAHVFLPVITVKSSERGGSIRKSATPWL